MNQSNGPKSPERKPSLDKEAIEARRIILARRAQYVALAMMAAGAATNACGGDVEGNQNTGGTGSTLTGGSSNTTGMHACLSPALGGTSARDTTPCLSIATGGRNGSNGGASSNTVVGGSGGSSFTTMTPCLSSAPGGTTSSSARGGMGPCLSVSVPAGGQSTTTTTKGMGGGMRTCLTMVATGGSGTTTRVATGGQGTTTSINTGNMGPCLSVALTGGTGTMGPCLSPPQT